MNFQRTAPLNSWRRNVIALSDRSARMSSKRERQKRYLTLQSDYELNSAFVFVISGLNLTYSYEPSKSS